MPCGATQDGWVMVERSERMWSTGEGNGKPLQYSCLENPMNSMKRQNDRILKEDGLPQVGKCPICYWRSVEKLNIYIYIYVVYVCCCLITVLSSSFAVPSTVAHQHPQSMRFCRQDSSFSWGSSRPKDQAHVSCIGR